MRARVSRLRIGLALLSLTAAAAMPVADAGAAKAKKSATLRGIANIDLEHARVQSVLQKLALAPGSSEESSVVFATFEIN